MNDFQTVGLIWMAVAVAVSLSVFFARRIPMRTTMFSVIVWVAIGLLLFLLVTTWQMTQGLLGR